MMFCEAYSACLLTINRIYRAVAMLDRGQFAIMAAFIGD